MKAKYILLLLFCGCSTTLQETDLKAAKVDDKQQIVIDRLVELSGEETLLVRNEIAREAVDEQIKHCDGELKKAQGSSGGIMRTLNGLMSGNYLEVLLGITTAMGLGGTYWQRKKRFGAGAAK